jgi:multidrug efflux pump subunit AcrA (membrane-fusion protein)
MMAGALADYRARQAEFANLEDQQRFLESEIARTELRAPIRGVVLTAKVEERRGQRLERGESFLDIADLSTMEIEASVPEDDISGVRPGASAELKVYSYPARTFKGTIVRVSPRADEEKRFLVLVRVANHDLALRPGMTGRARLDIPPRPILWPIVMPVLRWVRFQLWV